MEKIIVIAGICIFLYAFLNKTKTGAKVKRTWPFQILKFFWQGFVGMNLFVILVFGLSWWVDYVVSPGINMDPGILLRTYKSGIEQSLNHGG